MVRLVLLLLALLTSLGLLRIHFGLLNDRERIHQVEFFIAVDYPQVVQVFEVRRAHAWDIVCHDLRYTSSERANLINVLM